MWLLQLVWVSPFGATLAEMGDLPLFTELAAWGVLAWAATLLVILLLASAVRTRSRLHLAVAALVPAATIVAQIYAITSPLFGLSPAL
jgi:hypothetical protein